MRLKNISMNVSIFFRYFEGQQLSFLSYPWKFWGGNWRTAGEKWSSYNARRLAAVIVQPVLLLFLTRIVSLEDKWSLEFQSSVIET